MKKLLHVLVFTLAVTSAVAQAQYGWVEKSMFGGVARHRCVGVSIGSRGYMGLGHVNSITNIAYQDWWEYDPGTDTWAQKANYPGGTRYHSVGFAIGQYAYVGMGRDEIGNNYKDLYRYDAVTNTWSTMANLPGPNRRGAVAFAINGKGYVGTGSGLADFYEYDPATNTWTVKASIPGQGRTSAIGVAVNGKGYIGTGEIGGPSNDLYEYNPATNTWITCTPLPGLARMEACGFELNGDLYIATGDDFSSGTNYQDVWCYKPSTGTWLQLGDFAGAARRYMTSFTIGGRAYTGLGTSGINYKDLWEFGSLSSVEEHVSPIEQLHIFPNPVAANGTATLQWNKFINEGELLLIDMNGRLTRTISNISGTSSTVSAEGLAAGTYFIQLRGENGTLANGKILVQ
jgi:N-acetylneuraminic acid mutarotase